MFSKINKTGVTSNRLTKYVEYYMNNAAEMHTTKIVFKSHVSFYMITKNTLLYYRATKQEQLEIQKNISKLIKHYIVFQKPEKVKNKKFIQDSISISELKKYLKYNYPKEYNVIKNFIVENYEKKYKETITSFTRFITEMLYTMELPSLVIDPSYDKDNEVLQHKKIIEQYAKADQTILVDTESMDTVIVWKLLNITKLPYKSIKHTFSFHLVDNLKTLPALHVRLLSKIPGNWVKRKYDLSDLAQNTTTISCNISQGNRIISSYNDVLTYKRYDPNKIDILSINPYTIYSFGNNFVMINIKD
jgi:hypothetical protein